VLSVGGTPLVRNLAHEFHHSCVNRLAKPPSDTATADSGLRRALIDVRNEGRSIPDTGGSDDPPILGRVSGRR
jgi:hypothetical protein